MVPKKSSTNFWTVPFVDSSRVKKISGMDLEQCVIRIVVIKVVIAKCHRNRHHDQGGGQDYVLVRAWHGGLYGGAQVVRSHQVVSLRGALLGNNDDDDLMAIVIMVMMMVIMMVMMVIMMVMMVIMMMMMV